MRKPPSQADSKTVAVSPDKVALMNNNPNISTLTTSRSINNNNKSTTTGGKHKKS